MTSKGNNTFPVEVLTNIVGYADDGELSKLKLVNVTFCNAVDDILWTKLDIYLHNQGLSVKNSVSSFEIPNGNLIINLSLLKCLKRNAGRVTEVDLRIGPSFSINTAVEIISFLKEAKVKRWRIHILLTAFKDSIIDQLKKALSPVSNWQPKYTIELDTLELTTVVGKIHGIVPPSGELEIITGVDKFIPIENVPFSLFLTYGDTVTRLRLSVLDVRRTASLISFLEFCTNLKELHISMDKFKPRGQLFPENTQLCVPKSVKKFTLDTCLQIPAMSIIAHDIDCFRIYCNTFPASLQLKFSSVKELCFYNCAKASTQSLAMFAQMSSWKYLRLDTTDYGQLVRFKPVIRKTNRLLDISGTSQVEYGFDYLDRYIQWLNEMEDSVQQLAVMALPLPFLPPEKLKRFIVEKISPMLPRLERLFFRQVENQSGGLADLERLYPYLTPYEGSGLVTLYFLDSCRIRELENELRGT